jgi:steroid 5-alpha reductase family enzyme
MFLLKTGHLKFSFIYVIIHINIIIFIQYCLAGNEQGHKGTQPMKKSDRNALITFPVLLIIGFLFALAGSQEGTSFAGMPLYSRLVGLVFLIQLLAFIPAFLLKTERFYDISGSLTYIAITILAVLFSKAVNGRSLLLLILVIIWATRLGTFLFHRIQKAGRDDRFEEIKPSFIKFLNAWTIQAVWVTFTSSAALIAITSAHQKGLDLFAVLGFLVWMLGFIIEATADSQKSRFNSDPANQAKFIQTGVWSHSRHPNYFGEILVWVGVAIIALPVLQGWQWVAMTSPLFVILLLTRVSGIPLLEAKADRKWGGQPDYENYKKNTPVLIPRL